MTWTLPAPADVEGPVTGDDRPLLEGYLAWQRSVLLSVCAGLDAEQLARRPLPSTSLSLLGLLRHARKVERIWLSTRAAGLDVTPLYDAVTGKDTDFEDGVAEQAQDAVRELQEEWAAGDAAVAVLPFDHVVAWREQVWSLRMVYVHLIGEYARHNGHADLLREALDGVTGR